VTKAKRTVLIGIFFPYFFFSLSKFWKVLTIAVVFTTSEQEKFYRYCVIMAGGRGTRFWPRSRTASPKQVLDIISEKTIVIGGYWFLIYKKTAVC